MAGTYRLCCRSGGRMTWMHRVIENSGRRKLGSTSDSQSISRLPNAPLRALPSYDIYPYSSCSQRGHGLEALRPPACGSTSGSLYDRNFDREVGCDRFQPGGRLISRREPLHQSLDKLWMEQIESIAPVRESLPGSDEIDRISTFASQHHASLEYCMWRLSNNRAAM